MQVLAGQVSRGFQGKSVLGRQVMCGDHVGLQVSHELQEAVLSLQQMMRDSSETEDMINSISLDTM